MANLDQTFDDNYQHILQCWENFVSTGTVEVHNRVREVILESWKRSAKYGVDPFNNERISIDSEILIEKNRQLVEVAGSYMELIHSFVVGSGFIVLLIDKDGYIIKRIGDANVVDNANKTYLLPGENRSEFYTGTNAIGLALEINKPVQIFGPEHYKRNFQSWTCSCSPIKNPSGDIVGALNLSGHYTLKHQHTFALVVSAVRAIERELKLIDLQNKLIDSNKYLESVVDSVADGLIAVDHDGRIIKTNVLGLSIVGRNYTNIENLFDNDSNIYKNIKSGLDFNDIEYFFKQSNSYGLVSGKKINGVDGKPIGSLLNIKERQNLHRLVNRIVGSTATYTFEDIIGSSKCINDSIDLAKTAARADCRVLIEGESGTGKELFAQSIHNFSNRCKGPFVAVNCSAIPKDLVESELFGYEEGAFSGAKKKGKPGRFELADSGTLFLDEISMLPLDAQVKLLRVLQENKVMRLGGINNIDLNVRLIMASNLDLYELVKNGSFREDLYYRLSVFNIKVPPLRERIEDIHMLVEYFSSKYADSLGFKHAFVAPEVIHALKSYHWPGNIRELQNVVERAVIITKGLLESIDCLPKEIINKTHAPRKNNYNIEGMEKLKKQVIREALEKTGGNVTRAAKILGISRNTIYNKLKGH